MHRPARLRERGGECPVVPLRTRFARFLVSLRKPPRTDTQASTRWCRRRTWTETWTDEDLYAKYGITEDEIAFIESIDPPDGAGPADE